MVGKDGSEVASTDGNGHYEHASLIVHCHGTEAERASSPTRRPALTSLRRLIANARYVAVKYSFIKLNAHCSLESFVNLTLSLECHLPSAHSISIIYSQM